MEIIGNTYRNRCALLAVIAGLLMFVICVSVSNAETKVNEENPHVWKPRVKSVSVFKNGLGFFMRSGKVKLRNGWCVSDVIPPAAFGTLAIYAHGEDQVVDIVGSGKGEIISFDGIDAPKDISTKRERLNSLLNLNMELTYRGEEQDLSAAGKLRSIGPNFAILQNKSNHLAVPLGKITRIQILDLPVRVHVKSENEKTPQSSELGMAYLRKGITWIPEYTLKVLDEKTAELTLRGTLVNEAEDLIHCDVNFVVGVPHFAHTDYKAPIAIGQIIRTIGMAVAPAQLQTQMMNRAAMVSNIHGSQQINVTERHTNQQGGNLDSAVGNLPQMSAVAGTDYTVYTKKNLTVRRGEKAIITLFVKKIEYSHIYRWTPPGRMEHSLVLHNNTDTALTTGPCLLVSGSSPLGEDTLRYVPKGGLGEMPVTAAINIPYKKTEVEIRRKLKAYSPSRHTYDFYDLVTLKGELQIKNFEKRDITIIVTVDVPGKPVESTDDGESSLNPQKLRLLEREGKITWKLNFKPGEKKTITYSYERYIPSS